MLEAPIIRLFPLPPKELPLRGLYLAHNLRSFSSVEKPYLYTDFVTSLDGRIAILKSDTGDLAVPAQIANARDWRLFQELAVQADIIVVAGTFMARLSENSKDRITTVYDDDDMVDLRSWRATQAEAPFPDYAVVSNHLAFNITKPMLSRRKRIVILTGQDSDPMRRQQLEDQGATLVVMDAPTVHGRSLVNALAGLGYRTIFAPAGPQVVHMLLAAGVVDRLYLTHVHQVIGGDPYLTLAEGPVLMPPTAFDLKDLYVDSAPGTRTSQHFAVYDKRTTGHHYASEKDGN